MSALPFSTFFNRFSAFQFFATGKIIFSKNHIQNIFKLKLKKNYA